MKTVFPDTNVVLRFLLNDHHRLSTEAKDIFLNHKIYLDEVVVAEVVWVLDSYYQRDRQWIGQVLLELMQLPIVINPKKTQIIEALKVFSGNNLSYIDCWVHVASKSINLPLKTQDKKLVAFQTKSQRLTGTT
jgi:predicted nucleic-acid-binding protein